MKAMQEIRVYVVNDDHTHWGKCSNEEFMKKAEQDGTVYSLAGFAHCWNEDWLAMFNPDSSWIRIFNVECSESINFGKWEIETVKE